jgi:cytoskeleton protein RodZ
MRDHSSTRYADRKRTTGSSFTFGQRLKSERERRGLSLEEVAQTTRIGIHHLRALEGSDFDALPADVFVTGYLRAYAQCVNVDADAIIEDFTRERHNHMPAQADSNQHDVVEEMSRILRVDEEKRRRGRSLLWLTAFSLTVVLAVLGAWWIYSLNTGELQRAQPAPTAAVPGTKREAPPPRTATPAVVGESVPVVPSESVPKHSQGPAGVAPTQTESHPPQESAEIARIAKRLPTTKQPVQPSPEPATLNVPDYAVGTAVENRQLVGERDRFAEGMDVWFWTRVQGGAAGERIHHVWLREDVEAARISLKLGGPHWRTQSSKKLWPGSAGNWAVEARDDGGRVLARREFVCVP